MEDTLLNEIKNDFIKECHDDHVGLWVILWLARRLFPGASSEKLKDITLLIVREVLEDEQAGIVAGKPSPDGRSFVPWSTTTDETVRKIDEKWKALGREPNIGDIVWFTAKENLGSGE